jgi:hypothetical protein
MRLPRCAKAHAPIEKASAKDVLPPRDSLAAFARLSWFSSPKRPGSATAAVAVFTRGGHRAGDGATGTSGPGRDGRPDSGWRRLTSRSRCTRSSRGTRERAQRSATSHRCLPVRVRITGMLYRWETQGSGVISGSVVISGLLPHSRSADRPRPVPRLPQAPPVRPEVRRGGPRGGARSGAAGEPVERERRRGGVAPAQPRPTSRRPAAVIGLPMTGCAPKYAPSPWPYRHATTAQPRTRNANTAITHLLPERPVPSPREWGAGRQTSRAVHNGLPELAVGGIEVDLVLVLASGRIRSRHLKPRSTDVLRN